jgi:GNAT superfamily N-acetyltransferase
MDAAEVRIRRIAPGDGPVLRDLRLRSISDAPDAFGQPLEEAGRRPAVEWHRSARRSAYGDYHTWLIAQDGSETVGLVQGRRRRPATLLLFSMWVDPAVRRAGIGRRLIDELERWGRRWDASETILWVMGANQTAIDFYRGLGFRPVHGGQDAEAGARFGSIAMRRSISPTDTD